MEHDDDTNLDLSTPEGLWEDREQAERAARFDINVWLNTGRTDQFDRG